MLTVERLIELYGPIPERGLLVKCPCHNDRTSSLHIKVRNGQPLLHCFAGCDFRSLALALQKPEYKAENVSIRARSTRAVAPVRFVANVTPANVERLARRIGSRYVLSRFPAERLMYLSRFGVQSVLVFDALYGGQMMPLSPDGRYGEAKKLTLPGTNCKRALFLERPQHKAVMLSEGISDYLALYSLPTRDFDVCCVLGASHRPAVEDLMPLRDWKNVLLGFDNDSAGDKATAYYLQILSNALPFRPPEQFNDWREAVCAHSSF